MLKDLTDLQRSIIKKTVSVNKDTYKAEDIASGILSMVIAIKNYEGIKEDISSLIKIQRAVLYQSN